MWYIWHFPMALIKVETCSKLMPLLLFLVIIPLLSPWCQWVIGRDYWSPAPVVTGFAFPKCFIPLWHRTVRTLSPPHKTWSSTRSRRWGESSRVGSSKGSIRSLSRSREHFLYSHCVTKPTCSGLLPAKEVLLVSLILFQFLSMEILI